MPYTSLHCSIADTPATARSGMFETILHGLFPAERGSDCHGPAALLSAALMHSCMPVHLSTNSEHQHHHGTALNTAIICVTVVNQSTSHNH